MDTLHHPIFSHRENASPSLWNPSIHCQVPLPLLCPGVATACEAGVLLRWEFYCCCCCLFVFIEHGFLCFRPRIFQSMFHEKLISAAEKGVTEVMSTRFWGAILGWLALQDSEPYRSSRRDRAEDIPQIHVTTVPSFHWASLRMNTNCPPTTAAQICSP